MSEEKAFRSGFVALIGRPNVGKSTLMNRMIGQKIAITSEKPQTTRGRIQTVYTDDDAQIIFLDTPGIMKAKNRLDTYMVGVAEKTLTEVDAILWLVEPSTYIGAGEQRVIELLGRVKTPVLLVINKVDMLEKRERVLPVIEAFRGQREFAEILPVSALTGDGVDEVIACLKKCLPEGPQYYDEDTVTDQPMRQIAAELVREKALRLLREEIPHGIAVTVERMEEKDNGLVAVEATIVCEKESHKGIIIGKGGAMLKKIGTQARRELEEMMETRVDLRLWVKVRKEWRDQENFLREYGYTDKN
ncbi:MAG: GTPase Era [Lachnospiraceae bacterium]|nr:GTPase Era [Lachnospiraceae bacterium]